MPMIDAFRFLTRIRTDPGFRGNAPNPPSSGAFQAWVLAAGYNFSEEELANAFMSFRYRAVDDEELEELGVLIGWYRTAQGLGTENRSALGELDLVFPRSARRTLVISGIASAFA